ncbi:hypothetical protein [Streptomyces cinereoruber]|uniref:hypothetical protein n=1 Tax=Streptomyces cinereoruber TaxID=67260 RepID=UPI003624CE24
MVLGWVLALGLLAVLAVMEPQAAVAVGGLAVLTAIVLVAGKRAERRGRNS